jgi:hypothetical protein
MLGACCWPKHSGLPVLSKRFGLVCRSYARLLAMAILMAGNKGQGAEGGSLLFSAHMQQAYHSVVYVQNTNTSYTYRHVMMPPVLLTGRHVVEPSAKL